MRKVQTYNIFINESIKNKMKGKNKDDVIKNLKDSKLKPHQLLNKSIDNDFEEGIIYSLEKNSECEDEWFGIYVDKALIWAVENNKPEIVKLYINGGWYIKINDNKALRIASYEGYYDIVKLLLENGADVHADKDASIKWASANGHHRIVKLLLDYHANPLVGLKIAKRNGHHNIVRLLNKYIKKYPHRSVNESLRNKMKGIDEDSLMIKLNYMSPIKVYYTSIKHHYNKGAKMGIELLEKTDELNQNRLDSMLNSAVSYNNIEIAKILIEKGANVNGMDNHDILLHAVDYDNINMVKLLLDEGNFEQDTMDIALYNASHQNNPEITELLLKNSAKPIYNDLFHIMVEKGYTEIYRLLKKYETKPIKESLRSKMKGKDQKEVIRILSKIINEETNYLSYHIEYFTKKLDEETDYDMKKYYESIISSFNKMTTLTKSNPDELIIIDNESGDVYDKLQDLFKSMGFFDVDTEDSIDDEFDYTIYKDSKIVFGSSFDYDAPNILIFNKKFIIDKIKSISNEKS